MNTFPSFPSFRSQLSPDEEGRQQAVRIKALRKYRILAVLMTGSSVLSIVVGIIILVKGSGGQFPLTTGSPIWSGLIVFIGALFGIVLGQSSPEWKTERDKSKQRCLLIIFYAFAVTSLSFCGLCAGYSIWGTVTCGSKNTSTCGRNYMTEVAMNAIAAILAIVLFAACLIVSVMFCYYRNAFQFYSRQKQMALMQTMILQNQQQMLTTQNQVQFSQQPLQSPFLNYQMQYGGQQMATQYSNPTHYGGMNWSSEPPPPYSEMQYTENKF